MFYYNGNYRNSKRRKYIMWGIFALCALSFIPCGISSLIPVIILFALIYFGYRYRQKHRGGR